MEGPVVVGHWIADDAAPRCAHCCEKFTGINRKVRSSLTLFYIFIYIYMILIILIYSYSLFMLLCGQHHCRLCGTFFPSFLRFSSSLSLFRSLALMADPAGCRERVLRQVRRMAPHPRRAGAGRPEGLPGLPPVPHHRPSPSPTRCAHTLWVVCGGACRVVCDV
jgi:hypothetical protein